MIFFSLFAILMRTCHMIHSCDYHTYYHQCTFFTLTTLHLPHPLPYSRIIPSGTRHTVSPLSSLGIPSTLYPFSIPQVEIGRESKRYSFSDISIFPAGTRVGETETAVPPGETVQQRRQRDGVAARLCRQRSAQRHGHEHAQVGHLHSARRQRGRPGGECPHVTVKL